MAQNTRRGLEIGNFQGTRQEILRGKREKISSIRKAFPRSRSEEEQFEFLLSEIERLWDSQTGGGSRDTVHPDARQSHNLDQRGRVISLYTDDGSITADSIVSSFSTVASSISTIASSISTLEDNETFIHLGAQVLTNDPAATNPATWNPTMAGSRLSAWTIPNGSTNIFFWYNLPMPKSWRNSGQRCRTRVYYELNAAGITGSAIYLLTSGYGYSNGDLNTTPTVQWNEAAAPDVSSYVANTIYQQNILEGSATIGDEDFIGVRLNFSRANAGWTYTGGIYFHGISLELVD